MRVCFPFVGESIGGSHISALELIRHLPNYGVRPFVVLHQIGPLAAVLDRERVPFELLSWADFADGRRTNYAADVLRMKAAWRRFPLYLRRRGINIVHSNDVRIGCTWLGSAALGGTRFVWHQRTPGSAPIFDRYASRADRILCPSAFLYDRLLQHVGPDKLVQINNPVALAGSPCAPTAHGADIQAYPRMGFVANDWARKRPDVFLAAAAMVLERFPDAHFLIAGDFDAEARGKLLQGHPKPLDARIKFLGFVDDQQALFRQMDILVAPSVNEGFGRILVEAMLADVAVIAADSGGHREIVAHDHTGLLVPPDDVAGFAAAICSLIAGPETRRRLVSNARQTVYRYDPATITKHMADIYRQLPRLSLAEQARRIKMDWGWLHADAPDE